MSAPSEMGRGEGPDPTTTPRFSVRFSAAGAELVLAAPLAFAGGRVNRLRAAIAHAARVTDFARGWRALARRRSALVEAELEIDPSWLGIDAHLVGCGTDGLLFERSCAWGHVAFLLQAALDTAAGPSGTEHDTLLVPVGARAVHAGPRPPLAEVAFQGTADGAHGGRAAPRFDPQRGALVLGDVLLEGLTEALVGHGVRVPERGIAAERVGFRGGKLVLTAGTQGEQEDASLRETGRRIGPLIARAAAGDRLEERDLEGLPPSLRSALGAPAPQGDPIAALREGLAAGGPDAVLAARARAVDLHERAPGVATDALLAVLPQLTDPRAAREIALRAFARSPGRAAVLASALSYAETAELPVAAEILAAARQDAPGRDPFLDVALARLDERRGDHDAALARWHRATSRAEAPAEAQEGLAQALLRSGRGAEAEAAFARAAAMHRALGQLHASARAELAAARLVLERGEPRGALARLARLRTLHAEPVLAAHAVVLLALTARAQRAAGDAAEAAIAESALLEQVEARGPEAPDEAVQALLEAAQGALTAGEGARADAMAATLARARPARDLSGLLADVERAVMRKRIEAALGQERAQVARSLADSLIGRGRAEDAAELLHLAGTIERDLGLLRAAIDVAEAAGARRRAAALVERTLALVGEGPARLALEARRAKLSDPS